MPPHTYIRHKSSGRPTCTTTSRAEQAARSTTNNTIINENQRHTSSQGAQYDPGIRKVQHLDLPVLSDTAGTELSREGDGESSHRHRINSRSVEVQFVLAMIIAAKE